MGLSIQQVFATLDSWRNGKVENPTEVTIDQINGMSKSDIDKLLATKVSAAETALTIVGDQSFLPLNVGGSFEGGAVGYRSAVSFMETDGRVYMLRGGSDGRKNGVYYAELEFDTNGRLSGHTPTTIEYRPSFFPAGWHATTICQGYNDQIYGQLSNGNGGFKTFVAFTNYTLDSSQHTGIVIDNYLNADTFIMVYKDVIYFIQFVTTNGVFFNVYYLPLSTPSATPNVLIGWSGTGIEFRPYASAAAIMLANTSVTTDSTLGTYMLADSGMQAANPFQSRPRLEVYDIDANSVRFIFGHESWSDGGNSSQRVWVVRQITVNLTAKTYSLDSDYSSRLRVTNVNNNASYSVTDQSIMPRHQYDGGSDGNWLTTTSISPNGYGFSYSGLSNFVARLFAMKGYNYTTHKDLRTRNFAQSYVCRNYNPVYGSPLGGALYGVNVYDTDNICCRTNTAAIVRSNAKGWGTSNTFSLPSGMSVQSLELNADREEVEYAFVPARSVVEIVNDVVYRSTAIFFDGHLTGSTSATLQGETGTPVSISQDKWDAIHAAGHASLVASYGALTSSMTLLIVPQRSAVKPWSITFGIDASKNIYQSRRVLNFNGVKSGPLPTPTLVTEVKRQARGGNQNLRLAISESWGYAAITIADYDGFQVQAGCGPMYVRWTTDAGGVGSAWAIKNDVATVISDTTSQDHQGGGAYILPMPKLGVCLFYTPNDVQVNYTNLSGRVIGKNEADITASGSWGSKPEVVFMTNAVVGGWFVYFNERIPVTINGHSGTTKPAVIDLRVIAPTTYANHTFYVYARWVGGDEPFEIEIMAGALGANMSDDIVYLGTVATNSVGIESINVDKVVGISGFNLSSIRHGRTIPVTTGTPNETGTFNW